MGKQNRNRVCSSGLVVGIFLFGLFAVSAWAQGVPHEYYALRSTSAASNDLTAALSLVRGFSRGPQELVASKEMGFDDGNVSESSHAAVADVPALSKAASPAIAPCGHPQQVIQVVTEPAPTETAPPVTLTVKASALLELHEMRENAVNLCLELPAKYRTQLPECADIFKHEIRLKALAKQQQH
jgi:hypothetical protein